MPRIALLTPFSPELGGGSAQLRSHLRYLPDLDVQWKIVKGLPGSPWFPIAFVVFWTAFLLFSPMCYASMTSYQDFLVSSYFWILIGILYRLPSLALLAHLTRQPSHCLRKHASFTI